LLKVTGPILFIMQKKDAFIKFLLKRGHIKINKNIYHAPEAFKINALVSWCMKQTDQEVLQKSLLLLERFMAGAIDIQIKGDKLKVSERGSNK
jgi:hypothetical protein